MSGVRVRAGRAERKVARTSIAWESSWIYFLDPDGDVARFRLRGSRPGRPQKVAALGIERAPGFLYWIDADGDVARARLADAAGGG